MRFKRLAVAFLSVSLTYFPTQDSLKTKIALQSNSRLADLSPEEKKELEKKALALLGEIVNEAVGFRLVENRIQVLSFAAEILWKRDENRARGYLQEAVNQFLGMELPPAGTSPATNQVVQSRQALRTQLIQTIADRDPQMALDFLRTSRLPVSTEQQAQNGPNPLRDYEKQFEIQLVTEVAENDPQMALQLADEILKQGANRQVLEIWRRLQNKDPKSAAKLAGEILAKIRTADLLKNVGEASIINEWVFEIRERLREQTNPKNGLSQTEQPAISTQDLERSYRELLEIVVATVLKITAAHLMDINEQGQARNALSQARSLLPDIEKYVPSRAAALRAKLSQFDKAYYHPPTMADSYEDLMKKSSAELMGMAEKSKGEMQDMLYNQALAKAMEEGDLELAKQISAQHLKGSNDFMSTEIERMEREKALKDGKLDEARKTLGRLPSDADRALAMVRMAETVKDSKTQKELLGEAKAVLGDKMETRTQVETQLALAGAYLKFDPDYSFNLLDAAIGKLNSVISASIMLMKFTQEFQADDEEMRFTQSGMSYWFANGFDDKIFVFARKDFDRTQAAIARWQHSQTRFTMNMSLIAMILGDDKAEMRSRYVFGESIH